MCMSNDNKHITIGYFCVHGKNGGQTHLFFHDTRKPLCGTRLSPKAEYQWCSPHWQMGEPECERCKKIKLKLWIQEGIVRHALLARIKNYLEAGGLFNPELMKPDKVHNLILDLHTYVETH